jgi:Domain of unknown function (DUF5655)
MSDPHAAAVGLFVGGDPEVLATYDRLLAVLRELGPFTEEPKKTSVHLVRATGFAGVHPRKRSLILNLRTDRPLESARIARVEQVSKNRYHNEIKLERPADVDADLVGWLREAYLLGA